MNVVFVASELRKALLVKMVEGTNTPFVPLTPEAPWGPTMLTPVVGHPLVALGP